MIHYNWADLHPADLQNRVAFRDQLKHLFAADSRTERQICEAAGFKEGWARSILSTTSWRVASLQKLARVLGLEFCFGFDDAGLTMPAEDPHLATLRAAYPAGDVRGDEVARLSQIDWARRTREACGVGLPHLAAALNMGVTRLREWEMGERTDFLVLTYQRYMRALGRPVTLRLRPENGDPLPAVGQRTSESPEPSQAIEAVQVAEHPFGVFIWNTTQPDIFVTFSPDVWRRWLHTLPQGR